jgi:hypothetical protein
MKPSAFRIERLLAKVEAEVERRWLRARRYVFHPDEVAEAEAQGLPYVLLPRVCSPPPIQVINDRTGQCEIAEDWQRLDRRLQLPPGAA